MNLNTENSLLHYDYTISRVSSNEFVLSYQGKYFKIGEFMYQILGEGQKATHLEALQAQLSSHSDISLAALKEIIDARIVPLFKTAGTNDKELSDGFWYKKQILSARYCNALARPFAFLYGKSFYPLFVFIAVLNIILFRQAHSVVAGEDLPLGYEILSWVASYFSLFFIMFIHELGHAASAIKSGSEARSIGLGFYTIMPAMYTDLTDIWKLSGKDRIKTNLAGIYIQLIINLGIIAVLHLVPAGYIQGFIWKIYLFNSFVTVMNLWPFIKLDGYWVISDFLSVPNLIKASNQLLLNAVTKKDPFEEEKPIDFSIKNIILVVYTILRVLFIATITFLAFGFVISSIMKTIALIRFLPYLDFNFQTAIEVLKRIATIVIISFFTRKYRKLFSSVILKRLKWYRA